MMLVCCDVPAPVIAMPYYPTEEYNSRIVSETENGVYLRSHSVPRNYNHFFHGDRTAFHKDLKYNVASTVAGRRTMNSWTDGFFYSAIYVDSGLRQR